MAVKKTNLTAIAQPELPADAAEVLSKKLDDIAKLMEEQLHLQRVALLDAGHILRFNAAGAQRIAMSLPDAQDDFLQRVILRTRNFYEAKLLALVQSMGLVDANSVVCDVGANIGNHTVFFGRIMGAAKVVSFEPQSHCHATLRANIALNGLDDCVTAHNCLVGAKSGTGQMERFNARNLGGTAFTISDTGEIPMVALDDVIEAADVARLDLIKIDVEGMEMSVLAGTEGILESRHPPIWVELLARDNSYAVASEFLGRYGYKPTRLGLNDVLFRV